MATKFHTFPLAGTSHENRAHIIEKHCEPETPVVLEREPSNKFSKTAISVKTKIPYKSFFLKKDKVAEFHIGYVPGDHHEKKELLEELDKVGSVNAKIRTIKKRRSGQTSVPVVITFFKI
jgi:hypothetical protein